MSVRLGINPLTWSNDDLPALGAETPLAVCLSEGREAGFTGFELGNKFPRDPQVLGPILQRHDLALVSGWYSTYLLERNVDAEIAAVQPHLHLLKTLGASVMVVAECSGCVHGERGTPVSRRPILAETAWPGFARRLSAFGDYLASEGIRLAYHHHMGTVVETEAEVDRLMAGTDTSVGLLLDTGHLTYAGGDPAAVAARHAGRINHVHCKDIRPRVLADARNRDRSFLDAVLDGVFCMPGDGVVDYPGVFTILREAGYHGWLVVEAEQDPVVAPSLAEACKGHAYLQRTAVGAGLMTG